MIQVLELCIYHLLNFISNFLIHSKLHQSPLILLPLYHLEFLNLIQVFDYSFILNANFVLKYHFFGAFNQILIQVLCNFFQDDWKTPSFRFLKIIMLSFLHLYFQFKITVTFEFPFLFLFFILFFSFIYPYIHFLTLMM